MKRDDVSQWRARQEDPAKPFPYLFPQLPPRFRRCCGFAKTIFLLQWFSIGVFILGSVPAGVFLVNSGDEAPPPLAFLAAAVWAALPLSLVCRLLRHTPKFFWRCPCCGLPFPYYAPDRGLEVLREDDCVQMMGHFRVPYVKRKFCPLVLPPACPACGSKFFDMPDSGGSVACQNADRRL